MIRIKDFTSKATLKAAAMTMFLLLAAASGFGQQQVNLTAGPGAITLPDGNVVPMWGYSCEALASTVTSTATCAALSGAASPAALGGLGGVAVLNGGSSYSSAPTVTIGGGVAPTGGTLATATAVVAGGQIVAINLTSPGSGYTSAPTITITDGTGTGAVATTGLAWSPVVITVPFGATGGLQINLTNNLSFTPAGGATANTIPTSVVVVGQVGGGLGSARTTTVSPSHANVQGCGTWFIASPATPPGTPCPIPQPGASGTPPGQLPRVQSMATEVAAVAPGAVGSTPTALVWASLKPGTYLLESGTHPSIQVPMGLIGMLVVTCPPSSTGATCGTTSVPAGTAYPAVAATTKTAAIPAVQYNAEVPLEFSEIDPVQNKEVALAVLTAGFSETTVWSGMNNVDGKGAVGCGQTHTCYPPAVNYTPFYFLINGLAFNKTNPTLSLFPATAGTITTTTTTTGGVTTTTVTPVTTGITGTVLARLVNAGLRMHVPAIVGSQTTGFTGAGVLTTATNPVSGFTLIAEDGNPVPDSSTTSTTTTTTTNIAPRVKTEVFMAAGKTFDVMVNVPTCTPATTGGTCTPASLPIYDRALALSANSSVRDAGMLAYIGVNGAGLPPVSSGTGGLFASAQANADTYNSVVCAAGAASCTPLVISDPSKGVIGNDINVYGVTLVTPPTSGTLVCNALPSKPAAGICANGTFTYTPNPGTTAFTSDSFVYAANGATACQAAGTGGIYTGGACATVSLGLSGLTGGPSAIAQTYTAKTSSYIKIPSPGLLIGNSDPNNLPLSVVPSQTNTSSEVLVVDANGGFTLSLPNNAGGNSFTFQYTVQNSQGRQNATGAGAAAGTGTVTVNFPTPSNLQVKVLDAQLYNNCNGLSSCISALTPLTDYRWIIEEDQTFYVDPNCTTNSSITTPGCPGIVTGPAGQTTVPSFGVNFHTSSMGFVAQGCTGTLSCEGGQTMLVSCTAAGNPVGCTAAGLQHVPAVCDVGNGACRPDPTGGNGYIPVNPSAVTLNPAKRYYISVLPGDAANPFAGAYAGQPACSPTGGNSTTAQCGHTMSGAPIPAACNILGGPNACPAVGATPASFAPVTVLVLPTPVPTGKLSVIVFEDDFPLNGEQDGGGGNGTVAPIEPGLGGFQIILWDTYGSLGDVTGQDTYDTFNQPLSNSLVGTIDPSTGLDACPVSQQATANPTQAGITGMIVTCPKYEADGQTLSPLAGQAVVANLMPDKFSVQAYPGADRIARGEEWLQTNTLDGQHPHDSFIRIGEPSYFQEYGPAGYHVAIGFANPAIINARAKDVCAGLGSPGSVGTCNNTITGQVDLQRLSRTPDQRLYPSGSRDAFAWTQCWVSLGDPDGEDFMFTKCDAKGNFQFTGVPGGQWRLTIGDQWNDQIIDGLSIPANVGCNSNAPNGVNNPATCPGNKTLNLGNIGVQQWQSNVYTKTYIDDNKNGVPDTNEIGIPLVYTFIHYRDGSRANALTTDFNGIANFNETFPLFNWYVVEADSGRYKTTGIHTVYDAGGPADGSPSCGNGTTARQCGSTSATSAYAFLSNTYEALPLPADLSVPGAVYCAVADCTAEANADFAIGTAVPSSPTASTGRLDPPWVASEGFSGLTSGSNWIEFGKAPFASCPPSCVTTGTKTVSDTWGENGGIRGEVAYAATRPFDDASQMIKQPWEPNVPNVTVNLYQEGFAADGVTPTLTMVDTTQSSSWDAWAQGFYPNSTAGSAGTGAGLKPYMSCPGQGTNVAGSPNQDLFFFTLFNQPNYLDWYNATYNAGTLHALPYNSQFKCYDAMHIGNQVQPAPYDGSYQFPSSIGIDPTSGKLLAVKGSTNGVAASMNGTNCTICVANPDSTDPYRVGTPMLPPGKYVVEVVMPPGYEVYKEEDKNLLIGDNLIAPVTQQFAGLGAFIFIVPDQASVASMYDESAAGFNPNNFQDATTALGLSEELSGVPGFPGFQDPVWPCVGEMRVVPDYLSLFPQAKEVAPFAGATRPLCDRKEVTLPSQMSINARFFIYTSTHIAAKYTGVITDDFTSEFDPFAPQFGEKFAPPNMAVSTKDYLGNELSRVYSDHWGVYNGLTFSSWDVNPPNITGYSPTMMVQCMNDPGPILDTRAMIPNPNGTGNIANPTFGQMITDPLYNPAYSDFCYEEPYMPGLTNYTDTPVVPTQAFVGAGYNNVDCAYPDATPAIAEVDTPDGVGPWMKGFNETLTITSLGVVQVPNPAYSGPSANAAPFNLKTVTRNYGFGSTAGKVTVGGVALEAVSWTNTTITGTLPVGVPPCVVQQQTQYLTLGTNYGPSYCGQLVITAANGKQSVDTVTVTIGGKMPHHIAATDSIQAAIDQAAPGDLLIVDPTCTTGTGTAQTLTACSATTAAANKAAGSHTELLIMWKPVRLQGVGAASSVLNANAQPAGKLLDPWRRHINCLFGLTLQGVPYTSATTGSGAFDPTHTFNCPDSDNGVPWAYFNFQPNVPQIDRLPLEATVGWDATLNGNLAEQLQEPSLMGAFEGAGITVLGKGLEFHGAVPWNDGSETGAFPTVTTLLTGVGPNPLDLPVSDANPFCHTGTYDPTTGAFTITGDPILSPNPYPSNFMCNPSSIDGLTVMNSSQGGGGIFAHGWAHHLQVANNRVYNNAGTLTGGIGIGQGEFPTPYIVGGTTNAAPGSCSDGTGLVANQHLPYCLQLAVNVHNNYVTTNSSLGDELFSGTLSGGGGVTFCVGNDYYKFNYNWVCGNLSAGEGGGLVHLGEIQFGDIEKNSFVLNQSQNPTIPTNGGGIQIMGTPDTDPVCGILSDADCPPGLSDGTGHGLVINANLIQANMSESGAGGGIRLQQVNGTDVSTFPGVYPITAATEAPVVTIRVRAGAILPAVGDSVTIAGLTIAGYNGTFTVTHVGAGGGGGGGGNAFQFIGTTSGLANCTGACSTAGTYTDTTTGGTAQRIASANETAPGTVTITSTLPAFIGDSVTITGVTPTGYNGTYTVTDVPAAGTFTYADPRLGLAAGTGGTVTDSNPNLVSTKLWNSVAITNNVIVNNVAGWDGGGISLQDALNVQIVNNTIAHNDSLASSGVLTQSIGTPDASAPAGSCVLAGATASCPQSAGLTSTPNSSLLTTTFTGLTIVCPFGEPSTGNSSCTGFSNPVILNDLIFQNRSFRIGITGAGTGSLNQQNLVALFTATGGAAPTQTSTGACSSGVTYSDIGVRGGGAFTLNTQHTMLSTGAAGSNTMFISAYCNGSRVPPECTLTAGCGGPSGYGVPPGIVDATAPNPLFSLSPSATVDEGNNWINVSWGPLSLSDPSIQGTVPAGGTVGDWGGGLPLGNYGLRPGSGAIDAIPSNEAVPAGVEVPSTDFYGNPRPDSGSNRIDYGAIESQNVGAASATLISVSPNSGLRGTTVQVTLTGTNLTGASAVNVSGTGVTVSGVGVVSNTTVVATFTIAATATTGTRNVTVTTPLGTTNAELFSVTVPGATLTSISPLTGSVGATGIPVALNGTNLTGTTAITISGTGVTHGAITVNAAGNQITTTFSITRAAAVGARTVSVTTPGGVSNTVTFTVQSAEVTESAPSPSLVTGTTTAHSGTVTVSNASGANVGPLTITTVGVAKVGGAGGAFSVGAGGTCVAAFVLNPGSSCTVVVNYTPGGAGTTTATAHVTLGNSSGGTAATVTVLPNFTAN